MGYIIPPTRPENPTTIRSVTLIAEVAACCIASLTGYARADGVNVSFLATRGTPSQWFLAPTLLRNKTGAPLLAATRTSRAPSLSKSSIAIPLAGRGFEKIGPLCALIFPGPMTQDSAGRLMKRKRSRYDVVAAPGWGRWGAPGCQSKQKLQSELYQPARVCRLH